MSHEQWSHRAHAENFARIYGRPEDFEANMAFYDALVEKHGPPPPFTPPPPADEVTAMRVFLKRLETSIVVMGRRLRRLLELKTAYYNGQALNTDRAYDALEDAVREVDPTHPILDLVGAPPKEGWDVEGLITSWRSRK